MQPNLHQITGLGLLSKPRAHLAGMLCSVLLEALLQSCVPKPQKRPLLSVCAGRPHAVGSALASCGRRVCLRLIHAGRGPLPGIDRPTGRGRCAASAAVHAGHGPLFGTWRRGGAGGGCVAGPVGGTRSWASARCQEACVASWRRARASGGCVAGGPGRTRVWPTLMGTAAAEIEVGSCQDVGTSSAGEGCPGMSATVHTPSQPGR